MDWQLTCRVCLGTGDMVSLFDWDENNEQLSDKFTACSGIEVSKNDTLPTLICLHCVDRLVYAYQFRQQCVTSNETLKECLEEFERSSQAVASTTGNNSTETETITIKQENGLLLQYEVPIEHEPPVQRSMHKSPIGSVVALAPGPKKRGRPRKYPNAHGQIDVSPYQRKKPKNTKEEESLASLLANGTLDLKVEKEEEPENEELGGSGGDFPDDDPDFVPDDNEPQPKEKKKTPKKRKRPSTSEKQEQDDGEDVLLKETIMAFSEPIPEHLLNPKPKKKRTYQKKKYHYEKTHTCETCGASFTSNASLQAHIRRHLGIKPFVCSVCGFATVQRTTLKRHMRRHTGEKPIKCRHCDKMFADFSTRHKHECVCGYSCVMNEELKRHMLRHTGEKPYKCRICDRRFGDYGTRQKHERLHMGIRPYQCSLCGKSFTYSYVLSNHMLTHTGEKKYSCAPCNKKFTKAHHLKYHNKVHHKELYMQQQMEAEAKKIRQQMNATGLTGVLSGQIVDGKLQILQGPSEEDGEQEAHLEEIQEEGDDGDLDSKETHRAVAGMQAVVLDSEFSMEEDSQN